MEKVTFDKTTQELLVLGFLKNDSNFLEHHYISQQDKFLSHAF